MKLSECLDEYRYLLDISAEDELKKIFKTHTRNISDIIKEADIS